MSISNLFTDNNKPWQNLNVNSVSAKDLEIIENGAITPTSGVLNINGSEKVAGDIKYLGAIFPTQGGARVLGGFWTQLTSVVINNTTETSLFGTGTATSTKTMPPNSLAVGSAFQVQFLGHINTATNKTATIRFKVNGATVSSTTVSIDNTGGVSSSFNFDGYFTFRTVGVSGSTPYNTLFSFNDNGDVKGFDSFGTVPVDTTIANTIDVSWEWAAAGGAATIESTQSFIRTLA